MRARMFGRPYTIAKGFSGAHPHYDLAVPAGTAIFAPFSGVVDVNGHSAGPDAYGEVRGFYMYILDNRDPNNLTEVYIAGFAEQPPFRPGERVAEGTFLGHAAQPLHVGLCAVRNMPGYPITHWLKTIPFMQTE